LGRFLLGVDIGGTFTDFLVIDETERRVYVGKQLTTPRNPAEGVLAGWSELARDNGLRADALDVIVHGTTLVTNALVERKGARVGLLTTAGFRDMLEIAREWRHDIYDLRSRPPAPLVPRSLRRGVSERTDRIGTVEEPVDGKTLEEIAEHFARQGVESIAVCFINSYANPANERRAAEIASRRHPEFSVSLSSEICPEIGEYERASTTVINAYVRPLTERYLDDLIERLAGIGFISGSLYVMLSNGAVTLVEIAKQAPVRMIESGPAAGAMAASHYASTCGHPDLLSFDMGGTTAKLCLIERGIPAWTSTFETARVDRFKKGSGLPVRVPSVDLIEIGAGGGSLAWIDRLRLLEVGPESAGAEPGPACYARGGTRPTVTDADLVLGYLDPGYFLGGRLSLDVKAAERALVEHIAIPLRTDAVGAARAIHRLVNENMANAARIHSLERGLDPRRFALLAFGGAGPVHARQVARLLGAPRVIAPLAAGVASALGMLVTPLAMDDVRAYLSRLDEIDWARVRALFAEMEGHAIIELQRAGVEGASIQLSRSAHLRYYGQGREISVPIPSGSVGPEVLPLVQEAFDRTYVALFDRLLPGVPLESVAWRVTVSGPRQVVSVHHASSGDNQEPLKGRRPAFFEDAGGFLETPVYDRYRLSPGTSLRGPAILEERESTLIVGPGDVVTIDPWFNAVVHLEASPTRSPSNLITAASSD
jgi:N-methylhydantoinase A